MRSSYDQLLDAVIQHLKDLQARGTRFVPVDPHAVEALAAAPKPVPPARAAATRISESPPAAAARPASPRATPAPESTRPEPSDVSVAAKVDGVGIGTGADAPSPLSRAEREAAMADLRERALVCRKCPHLAATRRSVVFGVGDIHSPLMFVGEAPGMDEDLKGEPFVGKAGQLLTRIIQTMGLSRDRVYIANVLKCRPDTPDPSVGNRKPLPDEMKTCLPYLLAQIDIIRPKLIVALGATAVEGLFGRGTVPITRERGRFQDLRGIPVMPTYHPSYLLRNQSLGVKRQVWEDMLQVMEKLGFPITEKHRGYFLSK